MFFPISIKCILQISSKTKPLAQFVKHLSNKPPGFLQKTPLKAKLLSKSALVSRFLASNPHESITSIQLKKRPVRKKKSLEDEVVTPGMFNVVAYATSEEYNLEDLLEGLKKQDLYTPQPIPNEKDVVHAVSEQLGC